MTPSDRELALLASRLGESLLERGSRLATAESCTGGWIAKAATDLPAARVGSPGRRHLRERGETRPARRACRAARAHGAVSEPVAAAMAQGARDRFGVDVAVAVSGIAGPGGGTAEKPVGTVWFGYAVRGATRAETQRFIGDRETVRRVTVAHALAALLASLTVDAGG